MLRPIQASRLSEESILQERSMTGLLTKANLRSFLCFLVILGTGFISGCFSSGSWTYVNSFYGPGYTSYGYRSATDSKTVLTIPNIVYRYDSTGDTVDFNLEMEEESYQFDWIGYYYGCYRTVSTNTLYKLDNDQKMTCRIDVYDENDETIKECHEYEIGLNYPDGFWSKGCLPDIIFIYDGEQLYVSFFELDNVFFNSCLNDGTPFIPRDYIFYGWFHPDTTVKEYLNLPEETRCFSQEEIDKIVSVIYDLRDQYYRASSLKERKDCRKKIAEKLKQEYPIR